MLPTRTALGTPLLASSIRRYVARMSVLILGLGYSAAHFAPGRQRLLGGHRHEADGSAGVWPLMAARPRRNCAWRRGPRGSASFSIPPDAAGDPALPALEGELAAAGLQGLVYLSTIGVYGDQAGAWIDSRAAARTTSIAGAGAFWPSSNGAILARAPAFRSRSCGWAAFTGPVAIRWSISRAAAPPRIEKAGQVFNRIHVAVIAGAIAAAFTARAAGVFNVVDTSPPRRRM